MEEDPNGPIPDDTGQATARTNDPRRFVTIEITAILLKMLLEALPLARRALIDGGVELLDQECFWEAYKALEEYFDADEDSVEDPSGLLTIHEELLDLVFAERYVENEKRSAAE